MRANVVHTSLNECAGAERIAITVMMALLRMGNVDIDLTTFRKPKLSMLYRAFGQNASSVIQRISKINILKSLEKISSSGHYDLIINTHGDMLPYFHSAISKKNALTYCYFPYYPVDSKFGRHFIKSLYRPALFAVNSEWYTRYFHLTKSAYINMMRNSTILTFSEFSRKAIWKVLNVDSLVVNPPVDIDFFRRAALSSSNENSILIISSLRPSKKIENAIILAKLLRQYKIGSGMKIVGNLHRNSSGYYHYLRKLVHDYDLKDYVTFELNIQLGRLRELISKSKIYFHPLPGEHFGISIVEAMSAGLIPVVPDIGGPTEFVPSKYHFHTFGEALEVITSGLRTKYSDRLLISNSVEKYSIPNFIDDFERIVNDVMI